MRVVITATAKVEIAKHITYIHERNPRAAQSQRERIRAAAQLLRDHPGIGKPGRVLGTRELVIVQTPFLFVYEVTKTEVNIIHVMHGAQQWPIDEETE